MQIFSIQLSFIILIQFVFYFILQNKNSFQFYCFNQMESSEQSSIHEDILKVKRIWNDIKEVEKAQKRMQKQKTKYDKNKIFGKSYKQREKNILHKAISQDNLKNLSSPSNKQVINFSTVSLHLDEQTKSNSHSISRIDSFNNFQRFQQMDKQLSFLQIQNQRLKDQIKCLETIIRQKDYLIDKLKQREQQLLGETFMQKNERSVDYQRMSVFQGRDYKNDVNRLLKMLQTTKEFKEFAQLAIQDSGVRFLHQANRHKKSIIDAREQKKGNIHFCSCNSEYLQEKNLWVPEKVYDFAKQFVKKKQGEQLSQPQLELLLYELTRIWREREKRILNLADSSKALEVGKYKRKIQQLQRSLQTRVFGTK